MKCVYYLEREHPKDIPDDMKYEGLRYTVCMKDAPFMVNGSSYCGEHVKSALGHTTSKVGRKLLSRRYTLIQQQKNC